MAYDGTIPALGNLISDDIPAMQENFSLLESAQVVDEGTTADGDYIRYENGWQICIDYWEIEPDQETNSQEIVSGDAVKKEFPVNFISRPFASISFIPAYWENADFPTNSNSGDGRLNHAHSHLDTGVQTSLVKYSYEFKIYNGRLTGALIAIGRWK